MISIYKKQVQASDLSIVVQNGDQVSYFETALVLYFRGPLGRTDLGSMTRLARRYHWIRATARVGSIMGIHCP